MGSLLSILSNSATSMAAQSGAAEVASNNVSNANTAGYARQSAVIATNLPSEKVGGAYVGTGANLQTVSQARDRFLEAQLPQQFSQSSMSSSESNALASLSAFNTDGSGTGLTDALGGFYSSLQTLQQNPSDVGSRTAFVTNANSLALSFNRTAQAITSARNGIDADVSANVSQVNSLSSQMASLNAQIRQARNGGGEPNDLLDERQRVQDSLSQLTGAQPVPDAQGDISMVLGNGQSLVSQDSAQTMSAVQDPANGGHLTLTLTAASGASNPVDITKLGGTMGGEFAARDGALKTAQDNVDTLAFDFANTVNTVQQGGYTKGGVPGQALYNVGATASGTAASLSINANIAADPSLVAAAGSATAASGDASNIQALLNTQQTALSGGQNTANTLASLTASFGSSVQSANTLASHDSAMLNNLTTLRESVSGVSIDEEMANLTKAQNGYEAIAKVMQTTSDMLDTLMSIKQS